jgi:hypothetical protein
MNCINLTQRFAASCASLLLLCCLVLPGVATAQVNNDFGVPDDYPGLIGTGEARSLINVSQLQAKCGILYYYKLHGAWPADWNAVVSSGLFTAPLLNPYGQVITPDDGRIDFDHDLQFSMGTGWNPPRLILYRLGSKRNFVYTDMPRSVKTFKQILAESSARRLEGVPQSMFAMRAGDSTWLAAYASGCVLNKLLLEAGINRPGEINTWDDYVRSGFFPHSPQSLNPLTGRPWVADGAPGSLVWVDSEGPTRPAHLKLVDPDSGELVSLRL